jgi:hypothetical protein
MFALSILAGGLLAMLAMQMHTLKQGRYGRHTTEALQVARDQMEYFMRLPWDAADAQPTGWTAPAAITMNVQSEGGVQAQQVFNVRWRITTAGFEPNVRRLPNGDVQKGYVFDQEPDAGSRQPKGSMVTILVSSGKKNVSVPSLVGKSRDTAVKDLTSLGLDADVHEVPSDKPSDTVTAQDPRPGTIVVEGASVRVNVSSGPKPVAVPAVIGQTYDTAAAQLQAAGFTVGRADVESDQPAGEVVDQDPPGNSTASPSATPRTASTC